MEWTRVSNDDNGSLFTLERLAVGDEVQIRGEDGSRRVTFVMGSDRNGWRACFKGQGALPVGEMEWRVAGKGTGRGGSKVGKDPRPTNREHADEEVWGNRIPQLATSTASGSSALLVGFDSAWTRRGRGGIVGLELGADRPRVVLEPRLASFAEATEAVSRLNPVGYESVVLALDQPLVVENSGGRRPVERAVAPILGRLGGGVQPANRSRAEMFGPQAPIWPFLGTARADWACEIANPHLGARRMVIETFPALSLVGMFPALLERRTVARYNPERRSFRLQDWRTLSRSLAQLLRDLGVEDLAKLLDEYGLLSRVTKQRQDLLDSVVCLLVAWIVWSDRGHGWALLGDLATGSMIVPTHSEFRAELREDFEASGVSFR